MAEKEYIEREAAYPLAKKICDAIDSEDFQRLNFGMRILDWIDDLPAADVLPRDEAIKMGAELAAMHGSDATSQQLEEAYLKGVEDGMTRRDVRPVVHGKWIKIKYRSICRDCSFRGFASWNYCPNCGADMRGEQDV